MVNSREIVPMVMEYIHIMMVKCMMAIGSTIYSMGTVKKFIWMEAHMKVNLDMERNKDTEFKNGVIKVSIKVIGKIMKFVVKVNIYGQMAEGTWEIGKIVN